MEMHQLRYFLAVADEGNFTRAAAKCFVSQPSLSAQIIKLESELGQRLFDRIGRKAELTVAGRFLERRARNILQEVDNATRELKDDPKEVRGILRVGATPSVGPYLIPPIISLCRERYPQLVVRLEENLRRRLLEDVSDGSLDLALSSYSGQSASIDAEPILQESLNLVLPSKHPLARKSELSLGDFKDEPLVVLGESPTIGERVFELFGQNDLEPNVVALCTQVKTAKALVHQGLGVSILPEMAKDDIAPYDIVFRPFVSARMMRLVFILTHRQRYLTSAARAFMQIVREYVDRYLPGPDRGEAGRGRS